MAVIKKELVYGLFGGKEVKEGELVAQLVVIVEVVGVVS